MEIQGSQSLDIQQSLRVVPGCFAVIRNLQGDILMVLERDTRAWKLSGQIGLPGGKIDDGESPLTAILREVKEEVGIDLDYTTMASMKNDLPGFHMFDGSTIIPVWVYRAKVLEKISGFQTNVQEEIAEVFWMPEQELIKKPIEEIRPGVIEAIHVAQGRRINDVIQIKDGRYIAPPLPLGH